MRRLTAAVLFAGLMCGAACSAPSPSGPAAASPPAGRSPAPEAAEPSEAAGPEGGRRGDGEAPAEFVALREAVPGVREDIRYAGADNFTGMPVDGYQEPACLLTEDAARALVRAREALAGEGLDLLVYDCYRPRRAVAAFLRWAADLSDTRTREEYYPRVPKTRLFEEGYLAERSGHSRGSTVDLTLVRADSGRPLDMGTPYDFLDPLSAPDSPEVTARQRAARDRLGEVMDAAGFGRARTEWWHFTLREEPFPETYFDFPVALSSLSSPPGALD
ncbi:M15 family metallopeptidase [Streptomyces sp. DSM 44917]|uniref:D-alanyl-D-alanine dipeptidase n=1 Tax=Streptomyces boetiae TaxID=3075541 RepID=A0ABU2LE83_9ACTN|nr:M15 family metallopeptidase [Streptomyces sp. DSM 44917]MDT0309904.1 M15 family metallopeptidase [Streptomyces sp. DSM 44917]